MTRTLNTQPNEPEIKLWTWKLATFARRSIKSNFPWRGAFERQERFVVRAISQSACSISHIKLRRLINSVTYYMSYCVADYVIKYRGDCVASSTALPGIAAARRRRTRDMHWGSHQYKCSQDIAHEATSVKRFCANTKPFLYITFV